MNVKRLLFVMRQTPHGTSQAQEALDILLMASSFEHKISLLLLNEGILQLIKQPPTTNCGNPNFTSAYKALTLYDIHSIYISSNDLNEYNIVVDNLIITPIILTDSEIQNLVHEQDIIFNF